MPEMSVEKWAALKGMLDSLEENLFRLTEREADFVFKMAERVDTFGQNTYVSEKQWAWIRSIVEEKCPR